MINTDLDIDQLFRHSEELLLAVGPHRKITYMNKKAESVFHNASLLKEIEHLFSFDVCILEKKDILNYNPASEAFLSEIPFRAEILLQTGEDDYKKFNLRSFKNNKNTIIILSDISAPENEKRIIELEEENRAFLRVKERAKNLAIRTGLINRISNAIRDSLKLDEIIEIIINEVSATLGLDRGYFAHIDEINTDNVDAGIKQAVNERKPVVSAVMSGNEPDSLQPRLVTPVLYREEILGILVFYRINNKKAWHEEEIALIEGICSQLASAINQGKAQTRVIQAEKMASLGQLMAGFAHEINTPLGSINSNNGIFQKCITRISGPDDIIAMLNEATGINTEAIRRINTLVTSLKNFARLDEAEYVEADLHEGIKNTLILINHEIKDRIDVVPDFGEIPPIKCYPNRLNQVFMNILVNACHSMEGQGKITVKTEKIGQKVLLSIADTGHGIQKKHLARIFDPGFTTKNPGVGTGLGLSICFRIIEQHNGRIWVESREGKGSTFKIELPV